MTSLAFAVHRWEKAPMPGASGPVELARLPDLADGAFRAFVRFPPGWERRADGHYEAAEEFLVLSGSLTLEGAEYDTGAYGWIAARRPRHAMHSADGCLVYAWFGGMPLWRRGESPLGAAGSDHRFAHWRDAPLRELDGGLRVRELNDGRGHRTWVAEAGVADVPVAPGQAREVLEFASRSWHWDEPARGTGTRVVRLIDRAPAPAAAEPQDLQETRR